MKQGAPVLLGYRAVHKRLQLFTVSYGMERSELTDKELKNVLVLTVAVHETAQSFVFCLETQCGNNRSIA
jgi:hypothetical protein